MRSGNNVEVVAALYHLVFLQLQPAVADALAGGEFVFVAVPGADEMHFVGKRLPLVGAVLGNEIDDLIDQNAFAGRPAGMNAVIGVGVVGAAVVKHADLVIAGGNDAAVAFGQVRGLGDEPLCHLKRSLASSYCARRNAGGQYQYRRLTSAPTRAPPALCAARHSGYRSEERRVGKECRS